MSGAIGVGAVDINDVRPWWSGAGNSLDIMAPGVSIYSTMPSSGYGTMSGTSMATPHISAVVALLKQADPTLTVAGIRNALQNTAKDLGTAGWDTAYGWGIVDALAAVTSVLPEEPELPVHDVAVTALYTLPQATQGSVVPITIVLANEGNQPETFVVTVTDETDASTIGTQNIELNAGTSQEVVFDFYTTSDSTLGSHTIMAVASTVTDETDTADNIKTTVIDITEPVSQAEMHISDIDMSTETSRRKTRAVATVTIVDAEGVAVDGATVSGHWSGITYDLDTGATNDLGMATLYSNWKNKASGTFTFTIDNVVKDGWLYDVSANGVSSGSIDVVYSFFR